MVSAWGDWSTCTHACGGGEQQRTRTVVTPPANGGAECPGLQEKRACNATPPNACGGCAPLMPPAGQTCGRCGKTVCAGPDRTTCEDPGRTCEMLGATCGTPPDGCGGALACGSCPDALTTCAATLTCVCGKTTALYSPMGDLETGKRAPAPDLAWFATSAGIFATATAELVWPLTQVKGFDWHPSASGRFAQMEHFAPPRPAAVITIYQLSSDGRTALPVGGATSNTFHHYLAWTPDGTRLALGAEAACTTVTTVTPGPPVPLLP